VAVAAKELESKGYRLIHEARTEPWECSTGGLECFMTLWRTIIRLRGLSVPKA